MPKEREHLARKERKSCPKPKGGKILLREMDGKYCKKGGRSAFRERNLALWEEKSSQEGRKSCQEGGKSCQERGQILPRGSKILSRGRENLGKKKKSCLEIEKILLIGRENLALRERNSCPEKVKILQRGRGKLAYIEGKSCQNGEKMLPKRRKYLAKIEAGKNLLKVMEILQRGKEILLKGR